MRTQDTTPIRSTSATFPIISGCLCCRQYSGPYWKWANIFSSPQHADHERNGLAAFESCDSGAETMLFIQKSEKGAFFSSRKNEHSKQPTALQQVFFKKRKVTVSCPNMSEFIIDAPPRALWRFPKLPKLAFHVAMTTDFFILEVHLLTILCQFYSS